MVSKVGLLGLQRKFLQKLTNFVKTKNIKNESFWP